MQGRQTSGECDSFLASKGANHGPVCGLAGVGCRLEQHPCEVEICRCKRCLPCGLKGVSFWGGGILFQSCCYVIVAIPALMLLPQDMVAPSSQDPVQAGGPGYLSVQLQALPPPWQGV